jgi:hypothetical protein
VVKIDWPNSYRIVSSRYPPVGIFDRIADPADIEIVVALERRTNARVREEAGVLSLVRPEDRIVGPGTTPIMGAFTHTKPSRFSDGSFGIYYAAHDLDAAIAETRFHTEVLYQATAEPSADIDMRAYCARVRGRFADLCKADAGDPRLAPDSYSTSQAFGKKTYDGNTTDGITYPSVRDQAHRMAIACFRPRSISECHSHSYLLYRWDGTRQAIVSALQHETLTG